MLNIFKLFNKEESGQSLVFVALMLTVLIGFGALAVDVGYMTYQKSELQNAADAAVLAGAASIPTVAGIDIETIVVPQYLNDNISGLMTLTVAKNVKQYDNIVEVSISQDVPKFLGGFISSGTKTMAVHAKAQYTPGTPAIPGKPEIPGTPAIPVTQWTGEAMPFINFNSSALTMGNQLEVWDKVKSGYFECIENFDIINEDDPPNLYFQLDLNEGLQIKNGKVADKKQEIGDYYTYHKSSLAPKPYIYIFSLSPEAFAENKVTLIDGTVKSIDDLKNKADYVAKSSLVLIKCTFDNYDEKDGKNLYLTPVKIYDLGNNDPSHPYDDYPDNYENPAGETSALPGTPAVETVPAGKASIKLIE